MVLIHSHEEIDEAVKTAYVELGSPVPSNDEERKKLIFDIREKNRVRFNEYKEESFKAKLY